MARIGNVGGDRRSYRPTYNRRSASRRTSYQRPKAKPGPRATIKRKPKPVIRRTTKPKTVSRPTKKVSSKAKYTPSKAGMPSSVQNRIAKNTTTKKTWKSSKAGMPSSVADRLEKQEAAKQASKQISASKPVQTVSTGVSYQKTNTSHTPKQDTYAKIYKKPINTPVNPKVEKKNKSVLEDISLENGKNLNVNKLEKVDFKQKTDLITDANIKLKQNTVDKTILSENKPMYLTTREGKRIRVDNGLYKKEIKDNTQSLKTRQMISEQKKRRTETNEKNIATSYVLDQEKQFSFIQEKKAKNSILEGSKDDSVVKNLNQELYGADLDRIKYLFGKEFEQGREGIVRRNSKGLINQKRDVELIPGRKMEYEPDWEENYVTAGDVAYSDEEHQRSMAFYAEGSGPEFSFIEAEEIIGEVDTSKYVEENGSKSSLTGLESIKRELSIGKLSLVNGEVGALSWDGKYEHGAFDIDLLNLEANIGIDLLNNTSGLYAKGSVLDVSGEVYVPLPFTDSRLALGLGVDFLTLGGGVENGNGKDELGKKGIHPGIFGVDVIAGIKKD